MIQVKFFASVRECVGIDSITLPFSKVHMQVVDLLQVVERHTGCCLQSAHLLAAVNLEHVSMSTELQDNDEVAFFPPVTGG